MSIHDRFFIPKSMQFHPEILCRQYIDLMHSMLNKGFALLVNALYVLWNRGIHCSLKKEIFERVLKRTRKDPFIQRKSLIFDCRRISKSNPRMIQRLFCVIEQRRVLHIAFCMFIRIE